MRVLIFDTETTGIVNFKLPADHADQPDMVEIAALMMTGPDTVVDELDTLIQPDGWSLSPELTAIHGITDEMCDERGVPIADALTELLRMIDRADVVCGFAVDFDLKLVRGACRRLGMDDRYLAVKRKKFDCMYKCKDLCKVPPTEKQIAAGFSAFKQPTLKEASEILLGLDLSEAHQAMVDVKATAALYWMLQGQTPAEPTPAHEMPAPACQATSTSLAAVAPRAKPVAAGAGMNPDDDLDVI